MLFGGPLPSQQPLPAYSSCLIDEKANVVCLSLWHQSGASSLPFKRPYLQRLHALCRERWESKAMLIPARKLMPLMMPMMRKTG